MSLAECNSRNLGVCEKYWLSAKLTVACLIDNRMGECMYYSEFICVVLPPCY